jgi:hypothetical protein
VRGRRDCRPAQLDPAQNEPSVCRARPGNFNTTCRRRQRSVFCRVGRELCNVIAIA